MQLRGTYALDYTLIKCKQLHRIISYCGPGISQLVWMWAAAVHVHVAMSSSQI